MKNRKRHFASAFLAPLLALLLAFTALCGTAEGAELTETAAEADTAEDLAGAGQVPMYRLYNPNSGEHFYTANSAERDMLVGVGWRYESVGWVAPSVSGTPVYRLYNPNAGDHHYTKSAGERDWLISLGWNDEGIGWYSDDAETVPVYRQYNPNAVSGAHNYTWNKAENDYLASIGWNAEGIGWYAVAAGYSEVKSKIVCIDPGHQLHSMTDKEPIGPGSGTMKQKVSSGTAGRWSGKNEYEVNLEVGLKLQKELVSRGYTVVMTRTTNNVTLSNVDRAKIANNAGADIMVRLHCNGVDNSGVTGVLCYGPTLSNPYRSRSINQKSRKLAVLLRDYQCRATGQRARDNLYQDDMTGINWCDMPVTIVEMGFMSNRTEDLNLASGSFQDRIAQGLADGIDAYFAQNG